MASPKPLSVPFIDKDAIKQQLLRLLKLESAVDHFTENDQKLVYKGSVKYPASNIAIALPGFFEWLEFFDSGPASASLAAEVAAYRRWTSDLAARVAAALDAIFFSSYSGFALFREIGRGQDHTLTIRPTYSKDNNSDRGKQTETESDLTTVTDEDDWDDTANGNGADATVFVGELMLSPNGFASQLTFALVSGWPTDETLFHELVHAASMLTGTELKRRTKMASTNRHDRFNVDNVVEFLAVHITNIFRQERGRKGLRFNHDTDEFDGRNTLDAYPGMDPTPRQIIRRFRHAQHTFFEALADIPAHAAKINVMRQFRDESAAPRSRR